MSNGTTTIGGNFAYIAPGGQVNESLGQSTPYNDSAVGFIDVPDTTAMAVVFPISVGGITKIKAYYLSNKTGQALGVRLNGAVADEFNLPDGSALMMFCPTAPAANPLASISLVTTALQVGDGQILYRVFGD